MQIAIELPNDFVAFQAPQQVQRDIRLSYALWLFQNERVTITTGAPFSESAGLVLLKTVLGFVLRNALRTFPDPDALRAATSTKH